MKIVAIVIQPDGHFESISFDNSNVAELQGLVGGYIEAVASSDKALTFWVNEEGKLKGLPLNVIATLYLESVLRGFAAHDVLVGPVVLTGGADANGDTLGLTATQQQEATKTLTAIKARSAVL